MYIPQTVEPGNWCHDAWVKAFVMGLRLLSWSSNNPISRNYKCKSIKLRYMRVFALGLHSRSRLAWVSIDSTTLLRFVESDDTEFTTTTVQTGSQTTTTTTTTTPPPFRPCFLISERLCSRLGFSVVSMNVPCGMWQCLLVIRLRLCTVEYNDTIL